ncbi:MAG TPA: translation initiation factor IF-2, partial [Dehalococcoidia bacterium]|nr:translation initiation factor IF-2 [Dehalococcoidia bacterium]
MTEEKKKIAARHEGQESKTGVRMLPQVSLPPVVSVKYLADAMGISPIDAIKQLMRMGIMANINQTVDFVIAESIAREFGFRAKRLPATQQMIKAKISEGGKLVPRPPVITIMGHVDHGKTSLLDAIRKSNVVATEAGAITQHIGAYQVEMEGRKITILDTPGHEAFTAMRARGARATDIAVLVVAADDGVQPQTVEAINHAKAAGVPIVVALNKIDKANANPDRVKQQLSDQGLVIEEWGGDVICVAVSAKKREGIGELLENLLLLADILELKAEVDCLAEGIVVESKMDKNKGPLATLLVQKGTLKVGDFVVISTMMGKVKAMFNDLGKQLKKAEPATPAVVLGINGVVQAGDLFIDVNDEKGAKALVEKRKARQ